jgi:hypothetical protein
MAIAFASEDRRLSNMLKDELWKNHAYCRAVVTYNGTAGNLKIGTVLGKVTANGKYKIPVQGAADGSLVADAILIEDVTAALNTDRRVLVLIKGPAIVSKGALILDATQDLQAEKDAIYASLEAKGIQVNDSV